MNAHRSEEENKTRESFILQAGAFEQEGSSTDEYAVLIEGLRSNYDNYELYFMLGFFYRYRNADLAYLCFENALHYCDEPEDEAAIREAIEGIRDRARVRDTSVVIVSYNDFELMRECIRAIRRNNLEEITQIVVVDNASDDEELLRYLEQQTELDNNFILIKNEKNEGFPAGCNKGLEAVNPENDVFFLNNDAVLMPNSLFWLKMGLYSDKRNGAAGAVSNSASSQEVALSAMEPYLEKVKMEESRLLSGKNENEDHRWWRTISLDSALEASKSYSADHNVPMWNPVEVRCRLTGFAVLLRREAIRDVILKGEKNMIFDELFSPGYFEDDDLGIRLCLSGYRQVLCHNSFIYHHGGNGFTDNTEAMEEGREKFKEKWGFDIWNYTLYEEDKVRALLDQEGEKIYNRHFRLLDLTAGMGTTLSFIKHMAPDSYVAGITKAGALAGLSAFMADDIISGDPELVTFPWPEHSFDYIFAGDAVLEASNPEKLLQKLNRYLSENGRVI